MKKVVFFLIVVFPILFSSCIRKVDRKKGGNVRNKGFEYVQTQNPADRNNATSRGVSRTFSGAEIFAKYNSAVFMVFTSDGWSNYQGSGFFISSNGVGVSNYHVFKGTSIGRERIKLSDESVYTLRNVIKASEDEDIIIFQIESNRQNFNYIPIADISPKVGEKVFAIGSPRGWENTFSSGEISQRRENNMLQISVPIDHGSSGGALINEYGKAIGITSGGIDESGANLNFAIDIQVIKKYLK